MKCYNCGMEITGEPLCEMVDEKERCYCCHSCKEYSWCQSVIKNFKTGVETLDALLPDGMPRNVLTLVTGEAGTGKSVLLAELAYRALARGEPVVFVVLEDTALSLIQRFICLSWNIFPYLEKGQLRVLDGFAYRIRREKPYKRLSTVSERIQKISQTGISILEDPTDLDRVTEKIERALDEMGALNTGVVLLDSLTELASTSAAQVTEFVKDVRATVPKERYVPMFMAAHLGIFEDFPKNLEYIVDGSIDLAFDPNFMLKGNLIKQMRVRKMSGVRNIPVWAPFEIAQGKGLAPMAKADAEILDLLMKLKPGPEEKGG